MKDRGIGMMKLFRRLILGLMVWAAATGGAAAVSTPLIADLSDHLVAITTGFSGVDVLLFGAIEGEGDLVVAVRGPTEEKWVWRKEQKFGFWIGSGRAAFSEMPSFYRVASTRPLEDIAEPELWQRYHIGLEQLQKTLRLIKDKGSTSDDYWEALLRLQEKRGLYAAKPGQVDMLGEHLFRTMIRFPANVPVGIYSVEVYLIRDGAIVSAQTTPLSISKIGIGADIYDFAYANAPAYGILCIVLAVAIGWGAAIVLKKT